MKNSENKSNYHLRVAHQLRAPLVAMQSALKVAIEGEIEDPALIKRLIKQAYARSEDMLLTLNDLLELGRLESGAAIADSEPCNPADVLREVTATIQPLADEKTIELVVVADDALAARLDGPSLGHLFTNIIENAVKYSESGSEVKISLAANEESGLIFEVSDSGIGIPESDVGRIFDEYWRADNARKNGKTGTGLGLAIVKTIVDRAGGAIKVTSRRGKGTTFKVTLPI